MENCEGKKKLSQTRIHKQLQLKEMHKMIKKNPVTQEWLVTDDRVLHFRSNKKHKKKRHVICIQHTSYDKIRCNVELKT